MAVIDTNTVIEEDIKENIAEATIAELPPIMNYKKFLKVLIIERDDVLLSTELQKRLRLIGKPKSFQSFNSIDMHKQRRRAHNERLYGYLRYQIRLS